MKTLVTYISSTGNTKRVADAIYRGIDGDKELLPMSEVGSLSDYDLIFVGHPVQKAGSPRKVKRFLKRAEGKSVVLFITHAMPRDLEWFKPMYEDCVRSAAGTKLMGIYECQGELAHGLPFLLRLHPYGYVRKWARMGDEEHGVGHPDEVDLSKAAAFGRDAHSKWSGREQVSNPSG
ncbi:MAG TPA: flavodoxin family protein [Methanomassiliicoccales archaeon]|jgi:flavodoxin